MNVFGLDISLDVAAFSLPLFGSLINNLSYKHCIFELVFETHPACVSSKLPYYYFYYSLLFLRNTFS